MVRNNIFVDLSVNAGISFSEVEAYAYDENTANVLLEIAQRLDAYLSTRGVVESQARRPNIGVRDFPKVVKPGNKFPATMFGVENIADECYVHLSAGYDGIPPPFISTGVGKKEADQTRREMVRQLGFFALPVTKSQDVEIHASVAHAETYHPATFTFKIAVDAMKP